MFLELRCMRCDVALNLGEHRRVAAGRCHRSVVSKILLRGFHGQFLINYRASQAPWNMLRDHHQNKRRGAPRLQGRLNEARRERGPGHLSSHSSTTSARQPMAG